LIQAGWNLEVNPMYNKILVPLDGSPIAETVLPHVQKIARGAGNPEIILFRVCEPPVLLADYPADLPLEWTEHVKQETDHIQEVCRIYLSKVEKDLRSSGLNIRTESSVGSNVAEQIIDYAVKNKVDVIVLATHGRSGISRWAFGSVANKILHSSPVPVMIVRPEKIQAKHTL
jgi:nucleotide-binding universal stress UspA family protein